MLKQSWPFVGLPQGPCDRINVTQRPAGEQLPVLFLSYHRRGDLCDELLCGEWGLTRDGRKKTAGASLELT